MSADPLHSEFFKNRRKRRKIQPDEHEILEQVFTKTSHPSTVLRNILGAQLNMSARSVQIWFQNRRAKAKKTCAKLRSIQQKKEERNKEPDSCEELSSSPSRKRSLELDPTEEEEDSFSEEEFTDEEMNKEVQKNSPRALSPVFTCAADLASPKLLNNFTPRSVQCTSPTLALCGSSEPSSQSPISGTIFHYPCPQITNTPKWKPDISESRGSSPKIAESAHSPQIVSKSPEIPERLWNSLMSGLPLEAQKKLNGRQESKTQDLLNAALLGFESKLRSLIEAGVDINCRDEKGNTPLILAASRGHMNIVRLLLERRALVQVYNLCGRNALFEATANGFIQVVEELLRACDMRDIEQQEAYTGRTPLHCAVECGSLELCLLLLKKGANVYRADSKGRTTIEVAASRGFAYLRAPLLQYGSYYFQHHKVQDKQTKRNTTQCQPQAFSIQLPSNQYQQGFKTSPEPVEFNAAYLNAMNGTTTNSYRCSNMWSRGQAIRMNLAAVKETPKVTLV